MHARACFSSAPAFLFFMGYSSSASSFENVREKQGYSVGMTENACRGISSLLYSLVGEYIAWPNKEERRQMCQDIKVKYGSNWAFFSLDGRAHEINYNAVFLSRCFLSEKRCFIHALVTCDFKGRVINLIAGWRGSVHGSRALSSADYMSDDADTDELHFTGNQHGLGDSAFEHHCGVRHVYLTCLHDLP